MANPEHVEIVKKGAEAIAAWRKDHPKTVLDLIKANLSKADLFGANLNDANLSKADLSKADLFGAGLVWADLSDANLSKADLSKADLSGADLNRSDLNRTNLTETYLSMTDLGDANLSKAFVSETIFADVDLSDVVGLDTVTHREPSTIGVDTLFRSKGKIPASFLRGCGVPEILIEHLPSLIGAMQPIQFYSCFISHSSKDEEFTKRLHGRLEQEKLRVWYAPEDLKGGRKLDSQIDEAIRVHDKLLLVLSPNSMSSEWVRREIKKARKKEKQLGQSALFPIGLVPFDKIRDWKCLDSDSGEDLAEKVREYHIPDFSCWKDHDKFEAAFAKLMADLRASASLPSATTK